MISQEAIKAVFLGSLKLKGHESCLIVTDTIKEPIGCALYEYARGVSRCAKLIIIAPSAEHASEPPDDVAKEMLGYDVQILVTEKSLTHTRARREATKKGARIATMPSITEEIMNRCLDIDYVDLKKRSTQLCDRLKKARDIRTTTDLGTDITFEVGAGTFFGENGGLFDYPGAYGNLPEGEISFSPHTCDGVYVVDASFPGLGLLTSPLVFKVRKGTVYEITGVHAGEVIDRLNRVGRAAYRVAELGIGLNPKAQIIGNVLEDEKVMGTIHIAVGNNLSYGGANDVPLHLDGVISKPNVYVDNKKIMDKGAILWEKE